MKQASMIRSILAVGLAALVGVMLLGPVASAQKAMVKGCKIYMSKKPVPLKIFQQKNGNVLVSWFRSNNSYEFWESQEKEKGWEIWMLMHFQKPVNDTELEVSFYDVEVFPKHLIDSFAMMIMKKGEKIIPHHVKLDRKDFKVNHQYLMQVSAKKTIRGQQKFNLRGVAPVYSGEVVFTDEEAAGKKAAEPKKEN